MTHHRSAALQLGGFKGLSESENNALTDHKLDKHHSAYGPVCVAKTCKVMAGFDINDAYFVPRSMIELPNHVLWYVRKVLPRYDTWKAEAESAKGDKSTFCAMFLDDLLPWLVEVLVQDGCYFVDDFPEHVLSKLLRQRIPGYDRFALQSRRWVTGKQNSRQTDQIAALNGASKASYESLQRKVDELETSNRQLKDCVHLLDNKVDRIVASVERLNEFISALVTKQVGLPVQQRLQPVEVRPSAQIPQQPIDEAVPRTSPPTLCEALAFPPRQPPFESALPKTLSLLWREWDLKGLDRFRRQDKGRLGWTRKIRTGYERRMYLVDKILERAERLSISEEEAARKMDGPSKAGPRGNNEENRGDLTVYQFWQALHDSDVSILRRTRKAGEHPQGRQLKRKCQHSPVDGDL